MNLPQLFAFSISIGITYHPNSQMNTNRKDVLNSVGEKVGLVPARYNNRYT